jgi:hypothetical protein
MRRQVRSAAQWLGLVEDGASRRYQWTVAIAYFLLAGAGYLLFGFWGFVGGGLIVGIGTVLVDFVVTR